MKYITLRFYAIALKITSVFVLGFGLFYLHKVTSFPYANDELLSSLAFLATVTNIDVNSTVQALADLRGLQLSAQGIFIIVGSMSLWALSDYILVRVEDAETNQASSAMLRYIAQMTKEQLRRGNNPQSVSFRPPDTYRPSSGDSVAPVAPDDWRKWGPSPRGQQYKDAEDARASRVMVARYNRYGWGKRRPEDDDPNIMFKPPETD